MSIRKRISKGSSPWPPLLPVMYTTSTPFELWAYYRLTCWLWVSEDMMTSWPFMCCPSFILCGSSYLISLRHIHIELGSTDRPNCPWVDACFCLEQRSGVILHKSITYLTSKPCGLGLWNCLLPTESVCKGENPPPKRRHPPIPQHNPPLLPFNQVATPRSFLLMPGQTLDAGHCAVASRNVPQCLTKLLPKSVERENIFSTMIRLQCYFLDFWCEIHFC